ncbi:MAG: hypothetical protein IJU44_00895 [Kiritimatiellae bacterium]|nr:hypothetical protein [Kiritimatiellia bacterium]
MIKRWMLMAGIPVAVLASNWVVDRNGDWEDASNWANGVVPNFAETEKRADFSGTYTKDVTVKIGTPPPAQIGINAQGGKTVIWEGLSPEARYLVNTNICINFSEGHVVVKDLDFDICYAGSHALNVSADANKAAGHYSFLDIVGDSRVSLLGNLLIAGGSSPGGRITVTDTASLSAQYLFVGRGSNTAGGLIQRGGIVTAPKEFSIAHNENTLGSYELFDGHLILPDATVTHMSVNKGCMAGFYQHGGKTEIGTGGNFTMGDNSGSRSDVYIDGGAFLCSRQAALNARAQESAQPGDNTFTVAGNGWAKFFGNFIFCAGHYKTGTEVSQVNLVDDGVLTAAAEFRRFDDSTAGTAYLAFNGGTFENLKESDQVNLFSNLIIRVYEKGMTFRNTRKKGNNQTQLRKAALIRAPDGYGVAAVTLTDSGAGYLIPPTVTISGGSGQRATAIAQIDYDNHCVTNVIVTCPGEGFAEGDVVTVTFSMGTAAKIQPTRSAAATVTLAPNAMGPIRIAGNMNTLILPERAEDELEWPTTFSVIDGGTAYMAAKAVNGVTNVTVEGTLDIGGSTAEVNDSVTDRLPASIPVRLGGYRASESKLLMSGAASEETASGQTFGPLTLGAGKDSIGAGRCAGSSLLTIGTLADREAGAVFYAQPNGTADTFSWQLNAVAPGMLSGTTSPIVVGAIAVNASNESLGGLVAYDAAGKTLVPFTQYDSAFGPDANVELTANLTADAASVNSMLLNSGIQLTLSQKTTVSSGMVIFKGGDAVTRILNGELTSGNGKDLILHDMHVKGRRSGEADYAIIESKIVDADAAHPTALVVSGYKNATGSNKVLIKTGPSVRLANTANTYSGGTYINDVAIDVMDDGALGAVPEHPCVNIVAQGLSQIRAKNGKGQLTLHENRGIHVAKDAVLSFMGDRGIYQVTATVNGPLFGRGAIYTAEWAGGGKAGVLELNGDLSGFDGLYIVMGVLRIPSIATLSPQSRILFGEMDENDTSVGEGIIETSGVIDRRVGCEPGMVFWGTKSRQIEDLAIRDPGSQFGGGFSAYGGPLTVSLKANDGNAMLTWATSEDYHKFTPKRLRLQNGNSTHPLYWTAGVNFDGAARIVEIGKNNANAEVYWSGPIVNNNSNAATLDKRGAGQLILTDGADISSASGITVDLKKGALHFDVTNLLTSAGTLLTTSVAGSTVEKRGVGTVRLEGTSRFANVAVKAGLLELVGDGTSAEAVTVDEDGALHGDGAVTVGEAVTVDGELGAMDKDGQPATMSITGGLRVNGTVVSQLGAESDSLIAVSGDLSFGDAAKVEIPQADLLAARETAVPLMTATGTITGCPEGVDLPKGWKIRVRQAVVEAAYVPGGTIIIMM